MQSDHPVHQLDFFRSCWANYTVPAVAVGPRLWCHACHTIVGAVTKPPTPTYHHTYLTCLKSTKPRNCSRRICSWNAQGGTHATTVILLLAVCVGAAVREILHVKTSIILSLFPKWLSKNAYILPNDRVSENNQRHLTNHLSLNCSTVPSDARYADANRQLFMQLSTRIAWTRLF